MCASTTAKTSSTVRPAASMRARIAALISRVAALRSSGVLSQCGSGVVDVAGGGMVFSSSKDSLLETQDSDQRRFRQESFLECCCGDGQTDTGTPPLALGRARAA